MQHSTQTFDSDTEDEDNLGVSYSEERQIQNLQGKLEALDVASRSLGQIQEPKSPRSTRSAPFRSDADTPPLPPLPNYLRPQRRGTLELDSEEDAAEIAELRNMYTQVAECLALRHRFMDLSLQDERTNPKNQPHWKIHPPPPEPEYDPVTKQLRDRPRRSSTAASVGVDFNMAECPIPGRSDAVFALDDEFVYQVYETEQQRTENKPLADIPTLTDYYNAYDAVVSIGSDGPIKTFAYNRLQYLEAKWNLYILLNRYEEMLKSKRIPHRDFYNVRKVDTHVHHSACMTEKHLLRFIKSKLKKSPDEVVIYRDGKHLTLAQVFESLGLTAYDLNIDTLDMHAHNDSFHRFDKFNLKYNPVGESRLREIFLKTDNYIKGRYLAEITREVISDLEQSKYQMAEYRISIYGRSKEEWSKLAAWVIDNRLLSDNVRWLIQIPRLYNVFKGSGLVTSFGQVIENIFLPLFEVTQDPPRDPKLHVFLQRVIGFDSVDDESKADKRMFARLPTPHEWTSNSNPPYTYYLYYLYANMASLNHFRKRRGFNTFVLRPHAGEAGDPDHLAGAFLTSQAISHGILLRKLPFLQFLYYLDQIGIAMSPISNNALFLSYDKNPFMSYFRRGLNVSLSTDDPLQFSFTREPLIEEYSIACQIYRLSSIDSRELALASVKQCGFEDEIKKHWGYNMHTGEVNIDKTNVPEPRLAFRQEILDHERALVEKYGRVDKSVFT